MRCKSCDILLNDYDLRRKDKRTNAYVDLCGECFSVSEEARFLAEEAHEVFLEKSQGGVVPV